MLENITPPENTRGCRVGKILAELEPSDKQILEDALADTVRWSSHGLMTVLKQRGLDVSVHPIIRHRKNICQCSKI